MSPFALRSDADDTRILDERAAGGGYHVRVERGVLRRLGELVAVAAPAESYVVIADDRVAALHGQTALDGLARAHLNAQLLTFPAGEASKTRETWAGLTDALLDLGVGRDGCIVALGGGVTGDLAGFVAATYLRGIALVQAPTTLLAMIDASIGGKTGVDAPLGKNLIGAFHPPRLVAADPDVLHTLPDAQLRAGLAEAVKHGAIADPAYFEALPRAAEPLLARAGDALEAAVRRSIAIKGAIVAEDPLESGKRAVLNFGHTIAHAIERVTDYAVPHGFAVAMGLVVEARLGEALGVTEPGTATTLVDVLHRLGLPAAVPHELAPAALLGATRSDKKARASRIRYALIRRIGEPARADDGGWTIAVDDSVVLDVLDDESATR
jgi:3-dehydroquinate synthase